MSATIARLDVKLIRLGRAAGKIKYMLLNKEDISLLDTYSFEARTKIDPDGNGAGVYAWAFETDKECDSGNYVHELLWKRYFGEVPYGFKISHINGVLVDNRIDNLQLVPINSKTSHKSELCYTKGQDRSIYWFIIQQYTNGLNHEFLLEPESESFLNANGELLKAEDDSNIFYECHHSPCTKVEEDLKEFSLCGRCQQVRYCSTFCQQNDWLFHKRFCHAKPKYFIRERPPDR